MWNGAERLGVLTGRGRAALIVVDLDKNDHVDGHVEWRKLLDSLQLPYQAPQVITPSGGGHAYYRIPEGNTTLGNSVKVLPGIDIRKDGGYAVLPPSQGYICAPGVTPESLVADAPMMPAALIEALSRKTGAAIREPTQLSSAIYALQRIKNPAATIDKAIDDYLASASPGNFNDRALWLMCRVQELDDAQPGIAEATYPRLLDTFRQAGSVLPHGEYDRMWDRARGMSAGSLDVAGARQLLRKAQNLNLPAQSDPIDVDAILFSVTDANNAAALHRVVDGGVAYSHGAGWRVYTGHGWVDDPESRRIRTRWYQLHEQVEDTVRAELQLETVDTAALMRKYNASAKLKSAKAADDMVSKLRDIPGVYVADEDWDADPWRLAFLNGVVDLRTGTLEPWHTSLRFTKVIPFDFDPTADCPAWQQQLSDTFVAHPEVTEYIRRVLGYSVTGSVREQKFWVFHGVGGTGKSSLMEVVGGVLKPMFRSINVQAFVATGDNNPELASMPGMRIAFVDEGELNVGQLQSGVLKKFTGSRDFTASAKYKNPVTFEITAKLVISANARLTIPTSDDAVWRRLRPVEFLHKVPESTKDLNRVANLIRDEGQGILAWLVQAARDWYETGLQEPPIIAEWLEQYQRETDPLDEWLNMVTAPEGTLLKMCSPAGAVYLHYMSYMETMGMSRASWGRPRLMKELDARGFKSQKSDGKRVLSGIKVTSSHDPDAVGS
jgi:P4 family phage/plasmid primase-like protien